MSICPPFVPRQCPSRWRRPRRSTARTCVALGLLAVASACGADVGGQGAATDDVGLAAAQAAAKLTPAPLGTVAAGVTLDANGTALAADLLAGAVALQQRTTSPNTNAVCSPFAVQAALGMAYLASEGSTQADVASAMRWRQPPASFGRAWQNLTSVLATGLSASYANASTLEVGNRLWTSAGRTTAPGFRAALARDFGASDVALPFGSQPELSRRTINAWVATQTGQAIPELLAEGSVDAATDSVLTAALHLRGSWRPTFVEAPATEGTFVTGAGTRRAVATLHTTDTLAYANFGNVTAVQVPLGRGELQVLFVAPVEGTAAWLAALDANAWRGLVAQLVPRQVQFTAPKFAAAQKLALTDTLRALGMQVALGEAANLQFFADGQPDHIAAAFAETTLALDAQGIEAAAAAAVVARGGSAAGGDEPPVTVRLDRPFLYYVSDAATGTVLFAGQLDDPAAGP